ncbi:MAG: hypothetical protein WHT06_10225 [Desulfobacterales bacterium]
MDLTSTSAAGIRLRKTIRAGAEGVTLDADMIRLLLSLEEEKSLYQLAAEVDLDAASFKRALKNLLEQGLVEAVRTGRPLLGKAFFERLQIELACAVGPIASLLLEEQLARTPGAERGIPPERAAALVESLAREIPDERKRIAFQKAILPLLHPQPPKPGAPR